MFVKNSDELKNVELCGFLQEMDDEEKRIQNLLPTEIVTQEENDEMKTSTRVMEKVVYKIGYISAGVLFGSIYGGIFYGVRGAIGTGVFGGFMGNKLATNVASAKDCGMQIGNARLERLSNKIKNIEERLKLNSSADRKQLNLAKIYLIEKFKYYYDLNTKARPYYEWGFNAENDSKITTYFGKNGDAYHNGKLTTHTTQLIGNTVLHKYETTQFKDGYPK
jgi:hypothetical protein